MSTKTESRTDKLRAAHEKLQQAVAEIASGDDWKRMLGPELGRSSFVGCDLVRQIGLRPRFITAARTP